jgi:hypothetical protein
MSIAYQHSIIATSLYFWRTTYALKVLSCPVHQQATDESLSVITLAAYDACRNGATFFAYALFARGRLQEEKPLTNYDAEMFYDSGALHDSVPVPEAGATILRLAKQFGPEVMMQCAKWIVQCWFVKDEASGVHGRICTHPPHRSLIETADSLFNTVTNTRWLVNMIRASAALLQRPLLIIAFFFFYIIYIILF